MSWFRRRSVPFAAAAAVEATPVKGVEFSNSHDDYFQRNLVAVRTVTYAGLGSYGTMYRRQPAVRAVVDFLARNIAQLNPKVYERVGNTDRLEIGGHPLAVALRNPNPESTRYRHLRDTVSDLAIYDRAYWRKMRSGRRLSVVRVSPSALSVENVGGRHVYRLPNGEVVPREELVVFAGYSPDGSELGVSPLETLRRVLQEEAAAVQNREMMWHNAARQSGFIERPLEAPEWSDDARQRFREGVEATLTGGANSGRIGVLEEGMHWNAASFSPKDTDYVAGRRLTYEEVSIAYGVPPVIIGMGAETKSNAEAFHRQVYQDVLGPWLRFLQDEIELQLLPDFEPSGSGGVYVEFNLKEKLKGSFEEEQKAITSAVGVPHMSVNEGRARANLPRIDEEWADQPVQPLNVMYGGQPAVTIPTEDPGTASAPLPKVKAADPPPQVLRRREAAAREHTELFRKHFARQRKAVTSAKAATDRERWDSELTADLFLLATTTARKAGRLAARQIGGRFDEQRVLPYLVENARIAAESVNAETFAEIAAAGDSDGVSAVFDHAESARADRLGLGRATMLIAFARTEAAKHSEDGDGRRRMKTWVVTSAKSRHPEMDGETVPVGEDFSNGLPYPGSAGAGADEAAGCQCLMDIK